MIGFGIVPVITQLLIGYHFLIFRKNKIVIIWKERIVNQVVTKKLRKNCKKIWWIGKVVVTLQRV